MKVEVFHNVNDFDSFDFKISSIREALNAISLHKGDEYLNKIISGNHKFILFTENNSIEPIYLTPDVVLSDFGDYDSLLIIPEIVGEIGGAIVLAIGAASMVTAATATAAATLTTLGMVVAAAINIAISVALGAVMQLLSPTSEFSSDPSFAQQKQSSLFNGAPIITEQGGSVPIVFGNPYCGGVLISSSVSTADG